MFDIYGNKPTLYLRVTIIIEKVIFFLKFKMKDF
jgi:hypothetical protein